MSIIDILFLGIVGVIFVFTTDIGKGLVDKVRNLLPGWLGGLNAQNPVASENTLLSRAELWEQLHNKLDDPLAKKLMNDLWPYINKKPKGEVV